MSKRYKNTEETTIMVAEAALAYAQQASTPPFIRMTTERSSAEKIDYLREALHPSTIRELESVGWMENKPFPFSTENDDQTWIDEAEARGNSDIVSQDIINRDREAWHNLR